MGSYAPILARLRAAAGVIAFLLSAAIAPPSVPDTFCPSASPAVRDRSEVAEASGLTTSGMRKGLRYAAHPGGKANWVGLTGHLPLDGP